MGQWLYCCRIVNGIKNKNMKRGCINLLKRFLMVGTRYFASAPNDWHSIWYHYYGRTWSITSLPELVFRRRRAVFILLAMAPPSLGRAALGLWCGWFKRAWNQTCRSTNDRCEALASPKGCFFMFLFQFLPVFIHWTVFVSVPHVFIKNHGLPHIRNKSFS